MNEWDDAERKVERAQELFERRRWSEALEELRAAISINPYNGGWFFNIGLTLDEMERYDEAIEAYRRAIEIDANDLQGMQHLGVDLHPWRSRRLGRGGADLRQHPDQRVDARRAREADQVERDRALGQVKHGDLGARGQPVRARRGEHRGPAGKRAAGDVQAVHPVRHANGVPAFLILIGEPEGLPFPRPGGVLGLPGEAALLRRPRVCPTLARSSANLDRSAR